MKITRKNIRVIIESILDEQFTIPKHSKHSGFEYYSGGKSRDINEIEASEVGDDDRADMGGASPEDGDSLWDEDEGLVNEKEDKKKRKKSKVKNHAAGFLVGKVFPGNNIKFLGLIADANTQKTRGGIYDIPKGKFDLGETNIECAIRECFEESGILFSKDDVIGSPSIKNGLVIYSAITNDEPVIKVNPQSGIFEHEGFEWLSENEITKDCLGYLKESICDAIYNIKANISLK